MNIWRTIKRLSGDGEGVDGTKIAEKQRRRQVRAGVVDTIPTEARVQLGQTPAIGLKLPWPVAEELVPCVVWLLV